MAAAKADSLLTDKEQVPGAWAELGFLSSASDGEIRAWAKGSALGFSWLGPQAIRRNARIALLGKKYRP